MSQRKSSILIEKLSDTSRRDELAIFIQRHDHEFNPPLSTRVDLNEWIEKCLREAVIDLAWLNDRMVGVSIYYCTPDKFPYAFLTYICVDNEAKGKGVASSLLRYRLEYCRSMGSKGIETQTWESNVASRRLFEKLGFKEVDIVDNREGGDRSVLMRLDFDD